MAVAFDFAFHIQPTQCSLYYIDDKHKTEKPFFRLDEPFNAERQRTNIQINRHDDNTARDLRGLEHLLNFEKDGLEIHKFPSMMTERATPKDALECYRSEIAGLLHSRFKTETVVFYDCIVSFSPQPDHRMCPEENIISFANGHCPDLQNAQRQMLLSNDVLPLRPMLVSPPFGSSYSHITDGRFEIKPPRTHYRQLKST